MGLSDGHSILSTSVSLSILSEGREYVILSSPRFISFNLALIFFVKLPPKPPGSPGGFAFEVKSKDLTPLPPLVIRMHGQAYPRLVLADADQFMRSEPGGRGVNLVHHAGARSYAQTPGRRPESAHQAELFKPAHNGRSKNCRFQVKALHIKNQLKPEVSRVTSSRTRFTFSLRDRIGDILLRGIVVGIYL